MALQYGGLGVGPTLRGQPSNVYQLQPCEAKLIPAGTWVGKLGPYTNYQIFDTITLIWRNIGDGGITVRIESNGVNHRLCNQTGGTVGALITNAGTGYTSAPTVTASSGSSVWSAIVGGAVNTSVTVSAGGSAYVYPPEIAFSAPPTGGIQATGTSTISAGALATVVVTNQGAGYTAAPTISVINDSRDSTGTGGAAVAVTTGAGTITGLLATDHGNPLTAVPTLAFSGGGGSAAAATAIMCWSITGIAFSGGTGYTVGASAFEMSYVPQLTAGTPIYTNPATDTRLVRMRQAIVYVPTTATGAPTATGEVVIDGGIYQNVPIALKIMNSGLYPSATTPTLSMGGISDFTQLYPV
jgi:hypothetical protein